MVFTTKSKAMKLLDSNINFYKFKACTGQYNWRGSQKKMIERFNELHKEDNVYVGDALAIYFERRQDDDGVFAMMYGISDKRLG